MIKTNRTFVKNLNANDSFFVPGIPTRYVVVARRTMDNRTRVTYRIFGSDEAVSGEFVKTNLSTVDVVL